MEGKSYCFIFKQMVTDDSPGNARLWIKSQKYAPSKYVGRQLLLPAILAPTS